MRNTREYLILWVNHFVIVVMTRELKINFNEFKPLSKEWLVTSLEDVAIFRLSLKTSLSLSC